METIKEDFVSFETAKLLKEKGFNELCAWQYYTYWEDCKLNNYEHPILNENMLSNSQVGRYNITAPTQAMAMKWLREVHNIDIIAPPQYDNVKWTYSAIIFKLSIPCIEIRLNDNKDKKEETYEASIKYCLENLI